MQAAAVSAARREADRWDVQRRTRVDEILVDRAADEVTATVADIVFKQVLLQAVQEAEAAAAGAAARRILYEQLGARTLLESPGMRGWAEGGGGFGTGFGSPGVEGTRSNLLLRRASEKTHNSESHRSLISPVRRQSHGKVAQPRR